MPRLIRTYLTHSTLLRDFVRRDLRARYVGSSMGFFWSVVFPLINLFVFMFVFRVVLRARWSDTQGPVDVALIMLAGIVVWTGFAEAISRCTACLVDNANLIQKVVFPSGILPAFITVSALGNMALGIPIVLGATLWLGYFAPPETNLETPREFLEVWEGAEPVGPEGQPAPWPRIQLKLERAWAEDVTVRLTYGGTAVRGEDYLAEPDELLVPAGTARIYVPIVPVRDSAAEGDETIEVRATSDGLPLALDTARIVLHDSELSPEEMAEVWEPATAPYAPPEAQDLTPLRLGPSLVMLPVVLLLLAMFTAGIGSFLAAFNLYWRDTQHLIGVGLTVWMFATPIFYPAALIEPKGLGFILELNPMHWLIDAFRDVTLYGAWPDPWMLGKAAVVSCVVFGLASRFFARQEPRFPDLL